MSSNSNGKKKKRNWSFVMLVLGTVSFAIFAVMGLMAWHEYSQMKKAVQGYQESISRLEDTINNLSTDGSSDLEIIIQYPENEVISGSESVNFADAVAILQNQIVRYSDNINYMLAILSIVLTVVTIAIPLLNYGFFQKAHIDRIEEIAAGLEEEEQKRKDDFETLKNDHKKEREKDQKETRALLDELRKEVAKKTENIQKLDIMLSKMNNENKISLAKSLANNGSVSASRRSVNNIDNLEFTISLDNNN